MCISPGTYAIVRILGGGPARRIPPYLRGRPGKARRPSSHAPLHERTSPATAPTSNDRAEKLLVRARGEEPLEPPLSKSCGPPPIPATPARRLFFFAGPPRTSASAKTDLLFGKPIRYRTGNPSRSVGGIPLSGRRRDLPSDWGCPDCAPLSYSLAQTLRGEKSS